MAHLRNPNRVHREYSNAHPARTRLRPPRGLKIQLIEHRIIGLRHHRRWTNLASRPIWHAQPDDAAEAIRPQQGGEPCDRSAPVVPGNDCCLGTESIEQPHHIAGQMQQSVMVDIRRPLCLTIAAHIRRHDMEARLAQCLELMPPGIPGFGKTVTQHDKRSHSVLDAMHANAIGLDGAVFQLSHDRLPLDGVILSTLLLERAPIDRGHVIRWAASPEAAPQPSACGYRDRPPRPWLAPPGTRHSARDQVAAVLWSGEMRNRPPRLAPTVFQSVCGRQRRTPARDLPGGRVPALACQKSSRSKSACCAATLMP